MDVQTVISSERARASDRTKNLLLFAGALSALATFPALRLGGLLGLYVMASAILTSATLATLAFHEGYQSKKAVTELELLVGEVTRYWSWHIGAHQWDRYRTGVAKRALINALWWPVKGLVAAQLIFTTAIIAGGDASPPALIRLAATGFIAGCLIGIASLHGLPRSSSQGTDALLTDDGLCIGDRYHSLSANGLQLEAASITYRAAGPELVLEVANSASVFPHHSCVVAPIPEEVTGEALVALEHLAWVWGLDESPAETAVL